MKALQLKRTLPTQEENKKGSGSLPCPSAVSPRPPPAQKHSESKCGGHVLHTYLIPEARVAPETPCAKTWPVCLDVSGFLSGYLGFSRG